jgi:pantoate--beta-alanine ligase
VLRAAAETVERGGAADEAHAAALAVLGAFPAIEVEYLEVVDDATMQPVAEIRGPVRIAAAVWLGGTRLIDNLAAAPSLAR